MTVSGAIVVLKDVVAEKIAGFSTRAKTRGLLLKGLYKYRNLVRKTERVQGQMF